MPRKFHIFISSTPDDLKNERAALSRIIFEMGHIPICMDSVDNTEENGWKIIRRNIAESDYFLSLVAHKYGILSEGVAKGNSSLELEYAQALKAEVPVLALIIADKARWKAAKKERERKVNHALTSLKEKLRSHAYAEWVNIQELKQNARELLTREIFLNTRSGWVSGLEQAGPEVANALGRVMAENEDLKRRLVVRAERVHFEKSMRHTLEILAGNRITLSFFYADGENWENTIKCRYLRLFKLLVPELYLGKTTTELSRFLGSILNPDLKRAVRKDYPTPSNTIKKIMADLNLLRLVRYITNKNEEIWEVTEYGKEMYTLYRIRQFEKTVQANAPKAAPDSGEASGGEPQPPEDPSAEGPGWQPPSEPAPLEEATAAASFLAAVQAGYTESGGMPSKAPSKTAAKRPARSGAGKTAASKTRAQGTSGRKKK
jgi:hypothetical protein